jgi:hypothetical protein
MEKETPDGLENTAGLEEKPAGVRSSRRFKNTGLENFKFMQYA